MEGWREVRMKFGSQQMDNWSSVGVVVVIMMMMMMIDRVECCLGY